MTFQISEEMEFSTAQIAQMLNIKQNRVTYIINDERFAIPHRRTQGDGPNPGHIRVKLKDVDKIREADAKLKRVGTGSRTDIRTWTNAKIIQEHESKINALISRVEFLETQLGVEPEVVSSEEAR